MKSTEHIQLLGYKVKDKVTGIEGVVTSICFDLYGCIQIDLTYTKDGEKQSYGWIDVKRVDKTGKTRVMELPDYDQGYVANGNQELLPIGKDTPNIKNILTLHDSYSQNLEYDLLRYFEKTRGEVAKYNLSQLREELEAEAIVNVSPDLPVVPLEIILTLIDNLGTGELNNTT